MTSRILVKSLALCESMRPFTSILGIAGAYIGGIVAGAPFFSIPLLLAIIVVLFVGGGSMPFNDYFDRDVDLKFLLNHIPIVAAEGRDYRYVPWGWKQGHFSQIGIKRGRVPLVSNDLYAFAFSEGFD